MTSLKLTGQVSIGTTQANIYWADIESCLFPSVPLFHYEQGGSDLLGISYVLRDDGLGPEKKILPFINEKPYKIYKIRLYKSLNRQISFSELNLGKIKE